MIAVPVRVPPRRAQQRGPSPGLIRPAIRKDKGRQRRLMGALLSLLLHAGLLVFGTAWLIRQAHAPVEPGKVAMEIELTVTPPAVAPAKPAPSAFSPPATPVPLPPPIRPVRPVTLADTAPRQVETAPPPLARPRLVSPKSSQPVSRLKATPTPRPVTATRGALRAQPNELNNPPPDYPEESRLANEEGVVVLHVEITAAGRAAAVSIGQSSGYARLDQAALRAVRRWKFTPGLEAGMPVSSEASVPIRFKLGE